MIARKERGRSGGVRAGSFKALKLLLKLLLKLPTGAQSKLLRGGFIPWFKGGLIVAFIVTIASEVTADDGSVGGINMNTWMSISLVIVLISVLISGLIGVFRDRNAIIETLRTERNTAIQEAMVPLSQRLGSLEVRGEAALHKLTEIAIQLAAIHKDIEIMNKMQSQSRTSR